MLYLVRSVDLVNGGYSDEKFKTKKEAQNYYDYLVIPRHTHCDMLIKVRDLEYEYSEDANNVKLAYRDYEIMKSNRGYQHPRKCDYLVIGSLSSKQFTNRDDAFSYYINKISKGHTSYIVKFKGVVIS